MYKNKRKTELFQKIEHTLTLRYEQVCPEGFYLYIYKLVLKIVNKKRSRTNTSYNNQ